MWEITLYANNSVPETLPVSGMAINWSGRETGEGMLALEAELEKRLLNIRSEHMQWAYETGFTSIGDQTLWQALSGEEAPSMWWTSLLYERHPKLSPYLFEIYKIRCLEQILEENACERLILHGGTKQLRESLKNLCKSRQWQFKYFSETISPVNKEVSGLKKIYMLFPAPMRAILRFIHWQLMIAAKIGKENWKDRSGTEFDKTAQTATIVTYFPNLDLIEAAQGRFVSRYWESLHELLNRKAKEELGAGKHFVRWLFIRFPSPGLSLRQCLDLRDKFQSSRKDGLSFNYLEEFLAAKDKWTAIARWVKIALNSCKAEASFKKNCHFKNSRFNFWQYMKGQWAESFRGWRCLERCLQNNAFKAYFQKAGNQRWVLFPLENCPWERMCTYQARRKGADQAVYGSQHSIVRPTDFRYFDAPETFIAEPCRSFQPDVVGGNGRDACRQLTANGIPQQRLWQLEALRYLYLAKYRIPGNLPTDPLPPQPGEPLGYAGKQRLLLLTSFFADETRLHLELLNAALKDGILKDWHVDIKPHPFLGVNTWLENLNAEYKKNIKILTGSIENAFTPDCVVWTSNSTTAALEALLRKLPLMVMRAQGDFDLSPVQNVKGLVRTGNLAEFKAGLQNRAIIELPHDYLDLDVNLPAWKKLLFDNKM